MGSLSNYEIEDVARHYGINLIDCCMKDELPRTIKDGFYVVNLESSSQGEGTHWTTLIVQPNIAVFFDSFGAPPSTEIVDFVKKRKGIHMAFNNEIIQDLSSENCGYFCLYLCWFVKHHKGDLVKLADGFTRLFDENTKKNDSILRQLFRNIPDKKPPKPVLKLFRQKG
jgi:hypothetical protein